MELYKDVEVEDIVYEGVMPFVKRVILPKKKTLQNRYLRWEFVFDKLSFVFSDKDIEKIRKNLEKYVFLNKEELSFIIEDLKKSNYEYYNECETLSSNIYVKVDNCDEFFYLIYRLYDLYSKNNMEFFRSSHPDDRIKYLWLRMGIDDVNDVIGFLKKEISFAMNCAKLEQYPVTFGTYNGLNICYKNESNYSQFETNSHVLFSFRTRIDDENIGDFYDALDNYKTFELPVVHYGLKKDGNVPTCYIYGLQNLPGSHINKMLPELKELRNSLFNNNVSPFFIIALKLFIDLLASKGIYTIKVPLIQLFNYDFHEFFSKASEFNLENYLNSNNEDSKKHELLERQYKRFYNKEDLISFNKTERLIYTFIELEERFNNIEFLNDPSISGEDYLLIKIKSREYSMSHFEELKPRENKGK